MKFSSLLIVALFLVAGQVPPALADEAFDPATVTKEDFRFKSFEPYIIDPPPEMRVSRDFADLLGSTLTRLFPPGTKVADFTAFMQAQASFPTVKQEDRWLRPRERLTIKETEEYVKYSYRFVFSKRDLKKYDKKYAGDKRQQERIFHMEDNIFTWVILADLDHSDEIKRLRIRLEGLYH